MFGTKLSGFYYTNEQLLMEKAPQRDTIIADAANQTCFYNVKKTNEYQYE